ncbi:uncharacterized protein LOC126667448 [Mercurialis annua]|uniref:uncharacterized protein LOC126667448 n=1 Tax=Mercurialis annua TaxID=3986 RepID=UPI002160E615|nr:uncharacterized protein LOC126667448 [Mercurialis annua]
MDICKTTAVVADSPPFFLACFDSSDLPISCLSSFVQAIDSLLMCWSASSNSLPASRYIPKTSNWSLLMSSFTFVPASCVFGSSWSNWQQIFAHSKWKLLE